MNSISGSTRNINYALEHIASIRDEDEKTQLRRAESELLGVEVQGRSDFFSLRRLWSATIIRWIWILIIFNISLTLMIGFGILDFEGKENFALAVTLEAFFQVLGLGYVAVKYLFSDGEKYKPKETSPLDGRHPLWHKWGERTTEIKTERKKHRDEPS